MWILTCRDHGKVVRKFLKHSNTYQIGRSAKGQTSSTFLSFGEIYISKEHLLIEIKPPKVNLVKHAEAKSLLFIYIQSRAMTRINGQKYKLQKNQEPFMLEFTETQKLDIRFKDENAIEICIEWCDIFITTQGILSEDQDLAETLSNYYEEGLDIRVTNNPFKATHLLYSSDEITFNLVVALLRALPIVTSSLLDLFINYDLQADNLNPENLYEFLPMPRDLHQNLLPNTERATILSDALVFLGSDEKIEITHLIECLGGNPVVLNKTTLGQSIKDPSKLKELLSEKLRSTQREKCYFLSLGDEATEELAQQIPRFSTITNKKSDVYHSILDNSTASLKLFDFNICGEYSSIQNEQSFSPRKRRKFSKVGKVDFFNFEKLPDNLPQFKVKDSEVVKKPEVGNGHERFSYTEEKHDNQHPSELSVVKRALSNEDGEGAEPRRKKSHLIDKINDKGQQQSLSDAVRSTKQKATDFAAEDLGLQYIDNEVNNLDVQLEELAVVETADILRVQKSDESDMPKESNHRKTNFKRFRKNKPLRNQHRIEMHIFSSQENDVYEEDLLTNDDVMHMEQQCQSDFKDDMPAVHTQQTPFNPRNQDNQNDDFEPFSFRNGQKREPEQSLFVPESQTSLLFSQLPSQEKKSESNAISNTSVQPTKERTLKIPQFEQESSESDFDDELPKFTFRRR